MQNLSFRPPEVTEKPLMSGFKNYVEKSDSSGKVVLVEVGDPYDGISASSFNLDAQIEAGVPLQKISPISSSSLSSIDANNREAELFVENLIKPQVPQLNE